MYHRMTPAERARQTKIDKACHAMHAALVDLAAEEGKLPADKWAAVVAMFAIKGLNPADRYSVFQTLDEKPGWYGGYGNWHSLLRQVRNHHYYGRNLFNTINNRALVSLEQVDAEREEAVAKEVARRIAAMSDPV